MRCPGQSHGISERTLLPKGWSVPFVTKGTFWLKWLLPFKAECPAQETASYLLQMWGRRGTRPMCAGAATLPTRQHILDNNGGSHRGMWTNRRRQSNMSNRFLQDPSRRIINRGCSSHRSHNRNFFKSLEPTSRNILISNSDVMEIRNKGSRTLRHRVNDNPRGQKCGWCFHTLQVWAATC